MPLGFYILFSNSVRLLCKSVIFNRLLTELSKYYSSSQTKISLKHLLCKGTLNKSIRDVFVCVHKKKTD